MMVTKKLPDNHILELLDDVNIFLVVIWVIPVLIIDKLEVTGRNVSNNVSLHKQNE